MVGFFRFFSEKFGKKGQIDAVVESEERQKTIDAMVEENVLTPAPDGKRYAIHKYEMATYEIVEEKNGFLRVRDNNDKERWEEKELFYCDNIVYNTTGDFIAKERNKLLSLIDTGRYDVYIPDNPTWMFGDITPEMINANEPANIKRFREFIRTHTSVERGKFNTIFSNYIIIGF